MDKEKKPKLDVNQIAKIVVDRLTGQDAPISKPASTKKKNIPKKGN
jgi:hypothetical protein